MIGKIFFGAAIAYIGIVIIWRIFIAIVMIFERYQEEGFLGALIVAGLNLLMGIWDFAKFAFTILIIILIIKACS